MSTQWISLTEVLAHCADLGIDRSDFEIDLLQALSRSKINSRATYTQKSKLRDIPGRDLYELLEGYGVGRELHKNIMSKYISEDRVLYHLWYHESYITILFNGRQYILYFGDEPSTERGAEIDPGVWENAIIDYSRNVVLYEDFSYFLRFEYMKVSLDLRQAQTRWNLGLKLRVPVGRPSLYKDPAKLHSLSIWVRQNPHATRSAFEDKVTKLFGMVPKSSMDRHFWPIFKKKSS